MFPDHFHDTCNRREFMTDAALLGVSVLATSITSSAQAESAPKKCELAITRQKMQALRYFLEQRTQSGLTLDRCTLPGEKAPALQAPALVSTAACGYGLAGLALAKEYGVLTKREAEAQATQTLETLCAMSAQSPGGWLPHFVLADSGLLAPGSEHSSIDTVLMTLGALAAGECLGGKPKDLAKQLLDALDFDFIRTNGGALPDKRKYTHGYHLSRDGKPLYIANDWDAFSEGILVPLLALGKHDGKVEREAWTDGWDRSKAWKLEGKTNFGPLPLFTHYYPLGFLELEGKQDPQGLNPWMAAKDAVQMQLKHCSATGYPEGLCGITACDGPYFYRAYFPGHFFVEKVLAPQAQLACYPLDRDGTLKALDQWEALGCNDTPYGLRCAVDFRGAVKGEKLKGWKSSDAVGIDVGSTLMMLDAATDQFIYKALRNCPVVQSAIERAGFKPQDVEPAWMPKP